MCVIIMKETHAGGQAQQKLTRATGQIIMPASEMEEPKLAMAWAVAEGVITKQYLFTQNL